MSAYQFATGFLIGKRTDTVNTEPFLFGALQDITIDLDQKLEPLIGQYRVPLALGAGELKITGKAKSARMQMTEMANLFFGATVITSSALEMTVPGETGTVTSSHIYTVTNASSTPVEDFGLFYTSSGVQLQPVSSGPAVGQYTFTSSGASSGVYTLTSSGTDNGVGVTAYYTYTVSSGYQTVSNYPNPLMGNAPTFEIWFKNSTSVNGVTKNFNLKLNSCQSSKLSLPFSNQKWMIADFDFMAVADASNNVFSLSVSE